MTGEQIIEATWDAALLTNIDGAGVECEIVLGRQAGNPSVRTAGEVCAVEWNNDFALEGDPRPGRRGQREGAADQPPSAIHYDADGD